MPDEDELTLDPYQVLMPGSGKAEPNPIKGAYKQRVRRARILAVTREILGTRGFDAVSMREMARLSGCALQTVYNLVGSRDEAVTDAISEYGLFVGRLAARRSNPPSLMQAIDMWIEAMEAYPEFCRQCNLLLFSRQRSIYYRSREIQVRGMAKLLRIQQERGQLILHENTREVARQIILFAMAIFLDWAVDPFPIQLVRQRLTSGLRKLAGGVL